MRYCLFLQHEWFVQNLVKESIPTNMHTTVNTETDSYYKMMHPGGCSSFGIWTVTQLKTQNT